MKKVIALFAVVIMIAGLSNSVFAQNVNTTSGAKIVVPIQIEQTENTQLHFGTMANVNGGDVVLTPANNRSSADVSLLSQSPVWQVPEYTVTGTPSSYYTISLPVNGTQSVANGAITMPLKDFTTSIGTAGTLSTGGTQTFTLGATLVVTDDQAGGVYTGQFPVTVAYN